jgi:hypothetical protein
VAQYTLDQNDRLATALEGPLGEEVGDLSPRGPSRGTGRVPLDQDGRSCRPSWSTGYG